VCFTGVHFKSKASDTFVLLLHVGAFSSFSFLSARVVWVCCAVSPRVPLALIPRRLACAAPPHGAAASAAGAGMKGKKKKMELKK
jgi:hypothetical protein